MLRGLMLAFAARCFSANCRQRESYCITPGHSYPAEGPAREAGLVGPVDAPAEDGDTVSCMAFGVPHEAV